MGDQWRQIRGGQDVAKPLLLVSNIIFRERAEDAKERTEKLNSRRCAKGQISERTNPAQKTEEKRAKKGGGRSIIYPWGKAGPPWPISRVRGS